MAVMKVCRNCGYQNPDGNQFCQGCGRKLEEWGSAPVPPENAPRKKHTGVWIAVIVAAAAILAVILFLLFGTGLLSGRREDRAEEALQRTAEEKLDEERLPSDEAGEEEDLSGESEDGGSEDASVASIDYASPIPVPCSVTASSTLASSFYVGNLQDKDLTTSWAEGVIGNGVGESLTYRPQEAEDTLIYGIAVAPGVQTNLEEYKAYSYPTVLRISGEGIDETVNLNFYLADFEQVDNSLRFFNFSKPVYADELTISIEEIQVGEWYPDETCIAELWLYTCLPFGEASGDYWSMGGDSSDAGSGSEYILEDSAVRYLTEADLARLTQEQCRLAENEIYARHGCIFDDSDVQSYFESRSWYVGRIPAGNFTEALLNDYEKKNLELIASYGDTARAGGSGKVSTYQVVAKDISWADAEREAEAAGGHLAVITSREEYDKICSLADESGLTYLWLGAKLDSISENWDEKGWITGERWTYDNWYPDEPSKIDASDNAEELYLCMWNVKYNGSSLGWTFNDQRNDIVADFPEVSGKIGYIIEFEEVE